MTDGSYSSFIYAELTNDIITQEDSLTGDVIDYKFCPVAGNYPKIKSSYTQSYPQEKYRFSRATICYHIKSLNFKHLQM